jgi:L-asparaginase
MRNPTAMSEKPKILLLTTGGTVGMLRNPDGSLFPCQDARVLLERVPELKGLADIDLLAIANVDSSNLQPELWLRIARAIYQRIDAYDGFVVTHGTDTLAYTSAALSFVLQELPKPVILTGAQLPVEDIGTDARCNLINAVRVATSDIAEVAVVFGSQIIRGTRARKTSVFDMQAITSAKSIPLGNIGLLIQLNRDVRRRSGRRVLLQPFLNENVARIPVYPGFNPEILEYLSTAHAGIVLEGFGTGNIPTETKSLIPAIQAATEKNVPVVVCTQCIIGSTQMGLYQVGRAALNAGAIPAMDMTPETTLVKLMWVLGQTGDLPTVASLMQKAFADELDEID